MKEKRSGHRVGFAGISVSIILLLMSVMIFQNLLLPLSVKAEPVYSDQTDKASIEDQAGLLTEDEKSELLSLAADISGETGFELRLVTTDDAGGVTTQEYAENYFESLTSDGPDTASGASYVIDMDNREFYTATYGKLQYYLTDDRLNTLLDDAAEYISEGDYAGTFRSMLKDTEHFYKKGIADGTKIYNKDTGETTVYHKPKTVTPLKILISLLAGIGCFAVFFASVRASYGMKFESGDGFSARDNVHLNLTGRVDRLVNHFVTSRRIPKNNGGSGGSSGGGFTTTHTTSGGYSAGGGGRKF